MSKAPDENDRLRAGTLPADPSEETERARPLRVVAPDEKRSPVDPADLPSERALLGALLWAGANAPDALRAGAVLDILETGEPFYDRGHADTYEAIRACLVAKAEHDPIAVNAEIVKAGRPGRLEKLVELKDTASTVSERQARVYAMAIRTAWARRCAARDARLLLEAARDPKTTAEALLAQARESLEAMGQRVAGTTSRSVSVRDSAQSFFQKLSSGTNTAYPTGLRDLDEALNGGLRPGEVSVLAARTNVGKSLLAAQIAEHVVTKHPGIGVLYVTLEMAHEMFTARLVAARSGVPLSNLRRMVLNPSQWSQVTPAISELADKGLYFADNPSQSLAAIYSAALERQRILAREGKRLGLVILDHIGLVKPSAEALKKANREQQVAETSRGQRLIAGELGVHVLGIAQISRESEKQGANAMPKLSHLRESGAIEQDADLVLILHRERDPRTGLFNKDKPAALSIAKGRLDDMAIMLLGNDGARARFSNWNGVETFGDFYGL